MISPAKKKTKSIRSFSTAMMSSPRHPSQLHHHQDVPIKTMPSRNTRMEHIERALASSSLVAEEG
jgi:hypothetical protein